MINATPTWKWHSDPALRKELAEFFQRMRETNEIVARWKKNGLLREPLNFVQRMRATDETLAQWRLKP